MLMVAAAAVGTRQDIRRQCSRMEVVMITVPTMASSHHMLGMPNSHHLHILTLMDKHMDRVQVAFY